MKKWKLNRKVVNVIFYIMMLFSVLVIVEAIFMLGIKYLSPLVSSYINIALNITAVLFIIVIIVAIVMQIAFWMKEAYYHLSRYQGAKCFENIDFLNRNLGECNEYYRSRIREINHIYKHDPELQEIVKKADLETLYIRKSYLENQLDFFDNIMQVGIAIGVSLLVIILDNNTKENMIKGNMISEIIIGLIAVVGLILLFIAKYIGKGKGDTYTYNLHEYELDLLKAKIQDVNNKLCANEEIEKILEMRQAIVNVLADIYGSRRKRKKCKLKKKNIDNMVQTLYELPLLEIGDTTHLIWKKRKIGERECFFPVRIEKDECMCLNESYQKVDDILNKIVAVVGDAQFY